MWSGIFSLSAHLAAVSAGVLPASLRVSVLIQDLRSVEYSFSLHCNIPLQALRRRTSLRTRLAASLARNTPPAEQSDPLVQSSSCQPACQSSCSQTSHIQSSPSTSFCCRSPLPNSRKCRSFSTSFGSSIPNHTKPTRRRPTDDITPVTEESDHTQEQRLMEISQYWDSTCHVPLEHVGQYQCPIGGGTPLTVTYGEIVSGLRLRRSEILPSGRALTGSPYGFISCQSCMGCMSYNPWESPQSETIPASRAKRSRAMTCLDLYSPSDSQWDEHLKKGETIRGRPQSKATIFAPYTSHLSEFHPTALRSQVSSPHIAPKGRSLSRPRRRVFTTTEETAACRRASNIEFSTSPTAILSEFTHSELSCSFQHRTVCLPGRTTSVKFRKSGLLIRGDLNLDVLSDTLAGGSLIVTTSHLRYGSSNSGVESLIVNTEWRKQLVDQLMLVQRAVLHDSSLPWIVEGVVGTGGNKLSVTSCRTIRPHHQLPDFTNIPAMGSPQFPDFGPSQSLN